MSATFASTGGGGSACGRTVVFEWKPRSLIPVALASAVAAVLRRYLLGFWPTFSGTGTIRCSSGPRLCWAARWSVCWRGILSALLTLSVYAAEDALSENSDSLDVVARQLAAWRLGLRRPGNFRKLWDLV